MFPIKGKSKIPQSLSYPLNAKAISEAFADVPQAQAMSIFFFYHSTSVSRKSNEPYPVLLASYSFSKSSQYTPRQFEEIWHQPQWEIMVRPVPRSIKNNVESLLKSNAFPKIHAWLCAKSGITGQQQSQSLTVIYNTATEELEYKEHYHP